MNRIDFSSVIRAIAIIVVCSWIIVPSVQVHPAGRYLAMAATALWVLCEIWDNAGALPAMIGSHLCLLLFCAYLICVELADGGWDTLRVHMNLLIALFLIFISMLSLKRPKELYWPILFVMVVTVIVAAVTSNKLSEDVWAARAVVRKSDRSVELMSQNVGGYLFVYMQSILCPLLLYVVINARSSLLPVRLLRVLAALSFVTGVVVLWQASYGIAILSAIAGCLVLLVPGRLGDVSFGLGAVFLLTLLYLVSGPILSYAMSASAGTPLHKKVVAFESMLALEGAEDVGVEFRLERYERSMRLFGESPVMGKLSRKDVGKHSTILDVFAELGVIGGCLLVVAMFKPLWNLYRVCPFRHRRCVAAVSVCVFLHAILNNFMSGTALVAYLMMPFFISIVEEPEVLTAGHFPAALDYRHAHGASESTANQLWVR